MLVAEQYCEILGRCRLMLCIFFFLIFVRPE